MPRRRAGLEPPLRQLQLLQPRRQGSRRRVAGAAGAVVLQADMDAPVEEGAGRQHHGTGAEADADLRDHADHALAFAPSSRPPPAGTATGWAGSPAGGGSRPGTAPGRPARAWRARPGPCCELRMRNWMPASSVAAAIAPPSASISLTRWPLPMPPIDGLQLICPSVSRLCVSSSVRQPMRAAASAASVPAWPPPTTITSNSLG